MILHLTLLSWTFSLLYFIIIIILFFSTWLKYSTFVPILGAYQVTVVVKNIPANAGHIRRLRFDPRWGASLTRSTAAYPSILAWPILWTDESAGLQSVGLQRVGHNWSDLECMHAPIFNHLVSCLLWVRANIFPYKVFYSYNSDLSLNLHTKKLSVHPRCRIQCCLWWQNGTAEIHGIKLHDILSNELRIIRVEKSS